jgi:hypothetical protein
VLPLALALEALNQTRRCPRCAGARLRASSCHDTKGAQVAIRVLTGRLGGRRRARFGYEICVPQQWHPAPSSLAMIRPLPVQVTMPVGASVAPGLGPGRGPRPVRVTVPVTVQGRVSWPPGRLGFKLRRGRAIRLGRTVRGHWRMPAGASARMFRCLARELSRSPVRVLFDQMCQWYFDSDSECRGSGGISAKPTGAESGGAGYCDSRQERQRPTPRATSSFDESYYDPGKEVEFY